MGLEVESFAMAVLLLGCLITFVLMFGEFPEMEKEILEDRQIFLDQFLKDNQVWSVGSRAPLYDVAHVHREYPFILRSLQNNPVTLVTGNDNILKRECITGIFHELCMDYKCQFLSIGIAYESNKTFHQMALESLGIETNWTTARSELEHVVKLRNNGNGSFVVLTIEAGMTHRQYHDLFYFVYFNAVRSGHNVLISGNQRTAHYLRVFLEQVTQSGFNFSPEVINMAQKLSRAEYDIFIVVAYKNEKRRGFEEGVWNMTKGDTIDMRFLECGAEEGKDEVSVIRTYSGRYELDELYKFVLCVTEGREILKMISTMGSFRLMGNNYQVGLALENLVSKKVLQELYYSKSDKVYAFYVSSQELPDNMESPPDQSARNYFCGEYFRELEQNNK